MTEAVSCFKIVKCGLYESYYKIHYTGDRSLCCVVTSTKTNAELLIEISDAV